MQTPLLYHITGISGYEICSMHVSSKCGNVFEIKSEAAFRKLEKREKRLAAQGRGSHRDLIIKIARKNHICPKCKAKGAHYHKDKIARRVQCHNIGRMTAWVEFDVHRIYCPECGALSYEHIEFLTNPRSRITRMLEKDLVQAREMMSITDVSTLYRVPWKTVRNAEMNALERLFRSVSLKNVRLIGIDEICVFHKLRGGSQYVTIVRDLETGDVLNVSRGKGCAALKMFASRLKRLKDSPKIECVAMDMSNAYSSFVKQNLPFATIAFDHFHVIKMMNDILNNIRRETMAKIHTKTREALAKLKYNEIEKELALELQQRIMTEEKEAKGVLKGNRWLPLMNKEEIEKDAKAKAKLDRMLEEHSDLNTAYLLKEKLRSIYMNANTQLMALPLLKEWIAEAMASGIAALKRMAKTLMKNLEGVLGFWKYAGLTNAKTEGFNNKIRWLIKQAYGYRDFRYFRLKVFNLPNTKTNRQDW